MNNMVEFESLVIDLDLESNVGFYFEADYNFIQKLELRCLDYARTRKLPIGYLAYTSRDAKPPYKKRWVDTSSLRLSRLEPLRLLANFLADKRAYKLSASGVYELYSKFANFIFWSDYNGHPNVLDKPESFHRALIAYSTELYVKVEEKGRGNTENRHLTAVISVAKEIFPDDLYNFRVGIRFPGYSKDEQINTPVPEESRLFPLYKVADAVFKEILDFLKAPRKTPRSVDRYGERYWFLPVYYPLISETAIIESQQKKSRGMILTVIREHALRMVEMSKGETSISNAISAIVTQLLNGEMLENGNVKGRDKTVGLPKEFSSVDLERLAILAHDCFFFIFILNTNANVSTAANLLWKEGLEVETEVQRLRSIKRRADNKPIDIIFGVRFLRRLKEYLELREFLPSVQGFKYLFGSFHVNQQPSQVGDNPAEVLVQKLQRLVNKSLIKVGYRELRVYHHNKKAEEFGLSVAAESDQHTEKTALSSYTSGNFEVVVLEGVMYFSELGLAVEKHQNTQAGGCASGLIDAVTLDDSVHISPDCKNLMGCLFCKYYMLHLDTSDAKKLLSIDYIIEQLRAIQHDAKEFDMTYAPTQARVRWLLEQIEKSSEEMAIKVVHLRGEVFRNEVLTSYWQSKLNALVEIGII